MSQTCKMAQKRINNPLLTPVDGFSPMINSDYDECEISFEFGGLKGIMEEIEREDPMTSIPYDDEEISTKSSSPLDAIYVQNDKSIHSSLFLPRNYQESDLETIYKIQNAYVKPNNSEISLFTLNQANKLNFFNCNSISQPVRRKKIKISQILKKKWKTKLPSFIDNQRTKLISKINLIKNQNINKYKNENELKNPMISFEERYMEEKIPNRRMSHQVQNINQCEIDFFRKPSKSSKLKNYSNKFNPSENSDFFPNVQLNNRNSFYQSKSIDQGNCSNLQMRNLPVNTFGSIDVDYFPFETNPKNFYPQKSQIL